MKNFIHKKYVIGFIIYYVLHIIMLLMVNWYNLRYIDNEGDTIFSNLSILDGTLAPILFVVKFLYVSIFIFGVFLVFDKKASFESIFSAIMLTNLIYYIPQIIEFVMLESSNEVLTYGRLKNNDWASIIQLLPNMNKKSLLLPYLREINIFTFIFLGLVTFLINAKEVKFRWVFTFVSMGYFTANYFATTLIVFLTLLA